MQAGLSGVCRWRSGELDCGDVWRRPGAIVSEELWRVLTCPMRMLRIGKFTRDYLETAVKMVCAVVIAVIMQQWLIYVKLRLKLNSKTCVSVALERNQLCGGEARPKEPKLEARSAELEVGLVPSPLTRGYGEHCKLPQWGLGQSPGHQEFWCILGSSDELSCSPAIRPGSHSLQFLWLGS